MINKVLYLGPKGSYSDQAKDRFAAYYENNVEFEAVESIYKLVRRIEQESSDSTAAVLPIENSVEGVVRDTQDSLLNLSSKGFRIFAETRIPVEHSLISFGEKSQIKTLTSHPQALAQCKDYIYNNWGEDVVLAPVLSTSMAVASLTEQDISTGALASAYCANLYNVPIQEKNINDRDNNTTRFLLISNKRPSKSSVNKVSIVFSTENRPGALYNVLGVFEKFLLNMSYIDSRPSRNELGEYIFYVDFEGHIEDLNVMMALQEIQPEVKMFQILSEGAYCI